MFEALIVLGIIPGTNIQIGFLGWAAMFILAATIFYVARREHRQHSIRFMLISLSMTLTVRRLQRV